MDRIAMSLLSRLSRASTLARRLLRSPAVRRGLREGGRAASRSLTATTQSPPHPSEQRSEVLRDRHPSPPVAITYAPRPDDEPDPGEVVWAWVPYEEDPGQGKDRPVLVIAQESARQGGPDGDGEVLIALMLTSRDRTEPGGVARDQRGATWVDIGAGSWDRQGRPSEARADRLLRLSPGSVRRIGGRVDANTFDRVTGAVRAVHSWPS